MIFIFNKNILFGFALLVFGTSSYSTNIYNNTDAVNESNYCLDYKDNDNYYEIVNYSDKCRGVTNPYNNYAFLETIVKRKFIKHNKNAGDNIDIYVSSDENFLTIVEDSRECRGVFNPYDNYLLREVVVQKKEKTNPNMRDSLSSFSLKNRSSLLDLLESTNTIYLSQSKL